MNVEKKVFKRKIEQMKKRRKRAPPTFDNPNLEPVVAKIARSGDNDEQSDSSIPQLVDEDCKVKEPKTKKIVNIEKPKDYNSILTDVKFESLRGRVSDCTLDSVAQMGFSHMTEIQQKTIEPLLEV